MIECPLRLVLHEQQHFTTRGFADGRRQTSGQDGHARLSPSTQAHVHQCICEVAFRGASRGGWEPTNKFPEKQLGKDMFFPAMHANCTTRVTLTQTKPTSLIIATHA